MFVWFLDSVTKLFHTRSCENCRWDVPAAAVIHLHKHMLRLRTQFSTSFISTRMHLCFVVFISSIHFFITSYHRYDLSYLHLILCRLLSSCFHVFISLCVCSSFITFDFTHSNYHRFSFNNFISVTFESIICYSL